MACFSCWVLVWAERTFANGTGGLLAWLSKIAVCAGNSVNIGSNSICLPFLNSEFTFILWLQTYFVRQTVFQALQFCFPTLVWMSSFPINSNLMMKKDQNLHLRGLQLNPRFLVCVLILKGHAKFVGQNHKMSEKWSSAKNLNAGFMSKNCWEGEEGKRLLLTSKTKMDLKILLNTRNVFTNSLKLFHSVTSKSVLRETQK